MDSLEVRVVSGKMIISWWDKSVPCFFERIYGSYSGNVFVEGRIMQIMQLKEDRG